MGRRGIITIDGPAGAGKSTLGRRLAQSLGFLYLDSGALYRAVAFQAGRRGLKLADTAALDDFLKDFEPEVAAGANGFRLLIGGEDVSQALRSAAVSRGASQVALLPRVREWVKTRLRALAKNGGVVAEGRDQGTVVFPEADCKFYLDASLEARAGRRRRDYQKDGEPPPVADIMAQLAARDHQDESRAEAPLKVPEGAIYVDSTNLSADQVLEQCLARVKPLLAPGQSANKPSKPV